MDPFIGRRRLGQAPGFAGPARQEGGRGADKLLIVDMYAKAISGRVGGGCREVGA